MPAIRLTLVDNISTVMRNALNAWSHKIRRRIQHIFKPYLQTEQGNNRFPEMSQFSVRTPILPSHEMKYFAERKGEKHYKSALVNEDTMLRTHCCPWCFLGCANWETFVADTKCFWTQSETFFVSRTQNLCANVARAGKRGNICVGNNESATMCPRLTGPLFVFSIRDNITPRNWTSPENITRKTNILWNIINNANNCHYKSKSIISFVYLFKWWAFRLVFSSHSFSQQHWPLWGQRPSEKRTRKKSGKKPGKKLRKSREKSWEKSREKSRKKSQEKSQEKSWEKSQEKNQNAFKTSGEIQNWTCN